MNKPPVLSDEEIAGCRTESHYLTERLIAQAQHRQDMWGIVDWLEREMRDRWEGHYEIEDVHLKLIQMLEDAGIKRPEGGK